MRKWTTVDKRKWGEGPWQSEPDKVQWTNNRSGDPCLVVRAHHGALCCYVGVHRDHPFYGRSYDDLPRLDTLRPCNYAARCMQGLTEGEGVCHIPDPGRTDDVWWFGFDLWNPVREIAPCMDSIVGRELSDEALLVFGRRRKPIYRDMSYAIRQTRKLAKELHKLRLVARERELIG